jgi:spermidine dehydrogenase
VDAALGGLRIPLDNYAHMDGVNETQVDVGYFFDGQSGGALKPTWIRNIWQNDLAGTPWPAEVTRDLLRWRNTSGETTDAFRRSLDTMTYAQYLQDVMKLRPEVTAFVAPIVGLINGASPDAVSAFASAQIGMPGVSRVRSKTGPLPMSFPGGNGAFPQHFVKYLIPEAISGAPGLDGVHNGRVNFSALDRRDQHTRIRLGATVVRVEHATSAGREDIVQVAYEKGGKVYRVTGRTAIMASGGMMTRKVLADLPPELATAYSEFQHAPALVVNVALTNWRFLATLGVSSCRWFDSEFGFSCNIRRPMVIGRTPPPMHPNQPTVLTFYMGLQSAGKTLAEQASWGRQLLLTRTYADYERLIRRHMTRLFANAGFDARKDIAGIVLNRWGHARAAAAGLTTVATAVRPRAGDRQRLRSHRHRALRAQRSPERHRRHGSRPQSRVESGGFQQEVVPLGRARCLLGRVPIERHGRGDVAGAFMQVRAAHRDDSCWRCADRRPASIAARPAAGPRPSPAQSRDSSAPSACR